MVFLTAPEVREYIRRTWTGRADTLTVRSRFCCQKSTAIGTAVRRRPNLSKLHKLQAYLRREARVAYRKTD